MIISFTQIAIIGLVVLGALTMLPAVLQMRKMYKLVADIHLRRTWYFLYGLMIIFLVSYLASVYIIIANRQVWFQWLIGGVFFLGAVFVLIMVSTYLKTLYQFREVETRFQHMIQGVEEYAIIMLDKQGNILSWNSGAEKIKGYKAEEVIGKNFQLFYTQQDQDDHKPERLKETAVKEGKASDEGTQLRKDGTTYWGNVSITAIRDESGSLTGFSEVTRDLTERKKAEDAREQNMRQLQTKNKELEQFAYIASHDLQEPLRTITSLVDLLTIGYQQKLDASGQRMIKFLNEAAGRMSELIKGLLDYSRLGRESVVVAVDCNQMLRDIKNDLTIAIVKTGAVIEVESLPIIQAYSLELRLLFQNLITNAIKFSKPGVPPVIIISANQEPSGGWKFSVSDNGIGIADEFREKIFIIFQRLHNKGEYEGTGIGLAHCMKITELHKGRIWVESKPNEGSTFYFTINT